MSKGNDNSPQEILNQGNEEPKKTKNVEVNLENNDIQPDSSMIIGGDAPNLSPDAGNH